MRGNACNKEGGERNQPASAGDGVDETSEKDERTDDQKRRKKIEFHFALSRGGGARKEKWSAVFRAN